MTVELLRRLLDGGAPHPPIEAALSSEVERGVPFVRALLELAPELSPLLERELERTDVAEIHVVRASTELLRSLPPGMCERLMAVPVFRDPDGGRVDVAAVDVLDPHLGQEFAFQLGAKVRVLRAAPAQLRAALAALSVQALSPDEAPIPLVRRPLAGDREEPVLNLTRSKVVPPRLPFAFARDIEAGLAELAGAESPDAVARALCEALEPAVALVLAVRPGGFEARAASAALGDAAGGFSSPPGKTSVFDLALGTGFYLGRLPGTLIHAELRSILPATALEEVYVAPVLVAERPALVLLLAGFGPSLDATRRADRLVHATARALERILRSRKVR